MRARIPGVHSAAVTATVVGAIERRPARCSSARKAALVGKATSTSGRNASSAETISAAGIVAERTRRRNVGARMLIGTRADMWAGPCARIEAMPRRGSRGRTPRERRNAA